MADEPRTIHIVFDQDGTLVETPTDPSKPSWLTPLGEELRNVTGQVSEDLGKLGINAVFTIMTGTSLKKLAREIIEDNSKVLAGIELPPKADGSSLHLNAAAKMTGEECIETLRDARLIVVGDNPCDPLYKSSGAALLTRNFELVSPKTPFVHYNLEMPTQQVVERILSLAGTIMGVKIAPAVPAAGRPVAAMAV
jgi:hypothetical protein